MVGRDKYTKDGKKVFVIGELNPSQWIVQEYFIHNDEEVLGGPKFTENELFDHAIPSWKTIHLEKLNKKYEEEKERLDKEITKIQRLLRSKQVGYDKISNELKELDRNFDKSKLKPLTDFLSGKYNYVLTINYNDYTLNSFEDDIISAEGIKLISLFGKSGGDILKFGINEFSDGSGRWRDVYFFETEDEGEKYIVNDIINRINNGELSTNKYLYDLAIKYEVEIPKNKLDEYINDKIKTYMEEKESFLEAIVNIDDKVKTLINNLNNK